MKGTIQLRRAEDIYYLFIHDYEVQQENGCKLHSEAEIFRYLLSFYFRAYIIVFFFFFQ